MKRPEHPCLGSINRSPVIFVLCIWMSRCQTIPKLEADHPQKHRTSIERPNHPCLGSVKRSPVIFIRCMWTHRYQRIPKLEIDHLLQYRTGDIHSLPICSHVRRDEDSSLLAGLDMPFVSVNHPMFGDFNSEFSDVYEWVDAGVPGEEIVV